MDELSHEQGTLNLRNGELVVTYWGGSTLLREMDIQRRDHEALMARYTASENLHSLNKEEFTRKQEEFTRKQEELNRKQEELTQQQKEFTEKVEYLASFARISKEIRLRHLNAFARDNPGLCKQYKLRRSYAAIYAGNAAALDGDSLADMDIVTTPTEERLFQASYGIPVSIVRQNKNNDILIALINSRCSYYSQLPSAFHQQYDDVCQRLASGQSCLSQIFRCCGMEFSVQHQNGQTSNWADVVEAYRVRIAESDKYEYEANILLNPVFQQ
ncbi:hypothetical protein AA313_de0210018 [Arthrobotrys entomopaga]|nr:hypothetical protein AA313_de0210018 [Arthrobotrys entomopaga]